MENIKSSGFSLGRKALALLILAVAAWIVLQVIKGFVIAVFFVGVVVLAIVGTFWAMRTLRSR